MRALVLEAPHVFVEDVTVASIERAKATYRVSHLGRRLARYHDAPDHAFWGWNDIWLDPAFRAWNIEEYLPRVACPVLAIRGEADEYGTMLQVDRLAALVPHAQVMRLADCGHSPQRDQPDIVIDVVGKFVEKLTGRNR